MFILGKDHIIANNKELFTHEFVDEEQVNFCIAIDKGTGTIQAVLGFLFSSHKEKEGFMGKFLEGSSKKWEYSTF